MKNDSDVRECPDRLGPVKGRTPDAGAGNTAGACPCGEANQDRPFSSFSEQPNIVLLGDPGAGKTHLFHEAAAAAKGRAPSNSFCTIASI
jgi:hypothetical protein